MGEFFLPLHCTAEMSAGAAGVKPMEIEVQPAPDQHLPLLLLRFLLAPNRFPPKFLQR